MTICLKKLQSPAAAQRPAVARMKETEPVCRKKISASAVQSDHTLLVTFSTLDPSTLSIFGLKAITVLALEIKAWFGTERTREL